MAGATRSNEGIFCPAGHRVDKKKVGLKLHQILEKHSCAECDVDIPANATRYRCFAHCHFDVCETCYAAKGGVSVFASESRLAAWAARPRGNSYEFGDFALKGLVRSLSGIEADTGIGPADLGPALMEGDAARGGSASAASGDGDAASAAASAGRGEGPRGSEQTAVESVAEVIELDAQRCITQLEACIPVLRAKQEELEGRHGKKLPMLDVLAGPAQVLSAGPDAAELQLLKKLRGTPKLWQPAHVRYTRLLEELKRGVDTNDVSAPALARAEKAGNLPIYLEPFKRTSTAVESCLRLVRECDALALADNTARPLSG